MPPTKVRTLRIRAKPENWSTTKSTTFTSAKAIRAMIAKWYMVVSLCGGGAWWSHRRLVRSSSRRRRHMTMCSVSETEHDDRRARRAGAVLARAPSGYRRARDRVVLTHPARRRRAARPHRPRARRAGGEVARHRRELHRRDAGLVA